MQWKVIATSALFFFTNSYFLFGNEIENALILSVKSSIANRNKGFEKEFRKDEIDQIGAVLIKLSMEANDTKAALSLFSFVSDHIGAETVSEFVLFPKELSEWLEFSKRKMVDSENISFQDIAFYPTQRTMVKLCEKCSVVLSAREGHDTIDDLVQSITTEKRNAQKTDWSKLSIKRVGDSTGYLPFELLAGHSLYYVKKIDSNPPKGFFIQLEGNHKENAFKSLLESDLSKFKTLISGFDAFGFDEDDDPSNQ